MIENIQDTFYRTDSQGFLIFISPSGARVLGYDSPQKMIGRPVASLWKFPAERSDMLEIMERDGVARDYEVVLVRMDGTPLPVSTSSSYYHDKDGKILGVEGIFRDITERKQAEEALLVMEWKFRALFEKGPIGVAYHTMIYDISGKPIDYFFLDANETYKELTGVDPRGKSVTQAFPGIEDDPFDWIGTFGHVAQTGEQIRFEQYFQTNGQWYDCVGYQYKPDHFVAAFLNITKRKQAEEALKISSEKIQMFAYSVSHDLKNPAIAIYGLTRLLTKHYRDILDERGQNYCQQILKSAEQVTALVGMINTYISTKEISLEIESIKLVDLLLMIREEFEVSMNTRQIEWKVPELLPEIMADRIAILRVFRNFVDNALKYGGGDLSEIEIGYKEDDEHHILYVSDDGVGLTEEDSLNIFGLFERQKTASGIMGSGLGLAIVKEIAEQHGGQVWSETGSIKGITFNVSISKHL
jgi:PAS domain S-box-containing protein